MMQYIKKNGSCTAVATVPKIEMPACICSKPPLSTYLLKGMMGDDSDPSFTEIYTVKSHLLILRYFRYHRI